MKKFLAFVLGIVLLAMPSMYSQTLPPWTEDFDGTLNFTAIPTGSWISDAVYHLPGTSTSSPKSILGLVPTLPGNTAILETPPYNCTNYDYVLLRFSHICKVSPDDTVRIEYRTNAGGGMGNWNPLPLTAYMGNSLFAYNGQFNASTYPEWQGNDNTVFPSQSWWKEEMFDLASIANRTSIQFRFVIKHGQKDGTHVSYGWLIDNFKLLASTNQLYPPYIEFISPLVKDTAYSTGPWEINAKVRTSTNGLIQTPWLKYTNIENGIATTMDSVLMTPVEGDTLWKGIIPQFVEGTEVQYTITAYDVFGNYGTKSFSYIIKKGISGEWIIGTGTETTLYTPYYSGYSHGWSRSIYYDWEINPQGRGGRITSIAYNNANIQSETMDNLTIYVKPTLDIIIPQVSYIDPATDAGAVRVWGPLAHTTSQGWNVFTFTTPFDLPPGYNLMVYWINNSSQMGYAGHSPEWYYTQQSVNNNVRAYGDETDFSALLTMVYDRRRPNIKLAMQATNFLDNSVSLASIDTKDTVVVSPLVDVPIIASVRNRGNLNLDSVILHYDINGAIQGQKKVYPKTIAPWDFIVQDTIVKYTPKKNGWDTITVWVSMPNGKNDTVSIDDTLTKIIYGSTDVSMAFVMSPTDTVYYTGPYNINAQVRMLSGKSVNAVSLDVVTNDGVNTTSNTLPMTFDTIANLWKTAIPQTPFGNKVTYSITLSDSLGNMVTIENNFYTKRLFGAPPPGYAWFGAYDSSGAATPASAVLYGSVLGIYFPVNSWSRHLYLNSELEGIGSNHALLNSIAFRLSAASTSHRTKIRVYMKVTSETTQPLQYINPVTDGATLVYEGPMNMVYPGWINLDFIAPFYFPVGSNLMVYVEDDTPNYGTFAWQGENTNYGDQDMTVYGHPYMDEVYSANACKPVTRFGLANTGSEHNVSVALVEIESPLSNEIENVSTPVRVRIINKGTNDLTSCTLKWSRNGTIQTPVTYTRTLADGFSDTITIGSYVPIMEQRDTIVVWVEMPNGVADPDTYDDTLQIISLGCTGLLTGERIVGNGGTFPTLNSAIDLIRRCGMTGDLTLKLDGVFVENINLTDLSLFMNGYSLTITSLDNHPDSAIIKPATGTAIILNNTRNLTIQAITVDATTGTNAIQFTGACTNIVIRDCYLLADPAYVSTSTTLSNVKAPVCKASSTGVVDSVFFIHNRLNGGSFGIFFYGGTGSLLAPTETAINVIFDSNTVNDFHYQGVYFYFLTLTSCSYNTVLCRTNGSITTWKGFYMNYCNGPVIGNRVIQRNTAITQPYGMDLASHNRVPTANIQGRGLIANNEIIINTTTFYGIYLATSKVEIINNSIYVSGTGAARGIQISNSANNDVVIKNNNIVMTNSNAYPIYFNTTGNLTLYDIDYNNLYTSGTYAGYYSSARTLAEWQTETGFDNHSIQKDPGFTDAESSLKFTNPFNGFLVSPISPVNDDIDKNTRGNNITTIGCYEIPLKNADVQLTDITGLRQGAILSQTDSIKVSLSNMGYSTLTSINLGWSINDAVQNPGIDCPVSLSTEQSGTVTLDRITYTAGDLKIKVWVNYINGTLVDGDNTNDTIETAIFVCSTGYSGLITVGTDPNDDFPTIDAFLDMFNMCGASGDITLSIDPNTYTTVLDFSNFAVISNYTLTITSTTNDANDVIIRPTSTPNMGAVLLSNTNNITLKAITIDATASGSNAILFTGDASNIVVDSCRILTDPAITANTYACVYKGENTGSLIDLTIKNCIIDGGYRGIYLYGTNSNYCQNINIDNNTFTNQYADGIYLYYVGGKSVSYNRITPRTGTAINATWQAIYANNFRDAGNLIGNHILIDNISSGGGTALIGMYLSSIDNALVANNEVYINGNATTTDGIYVYYPKAVRVINNTVYTIKAGTSGTNRAHYNYANDAGYSSVVRNNIFVASGGASGTTYAFYLFGTSSNFDNYKANYDIDYNSYSSTGTNIGYIRGGARTWANWITANIAPMDINTVNHSPTFSDVTTDLSLATYPDILSCPRLADVPSDINAIIRPPSTWMGAYTQPPIGSDLMLLGFSTWIDKVTDKQRIEINIDVLNMGAEPITNAVFSWSVNGTQENAVALSITPPLNSLEQRNIHLATYQVANADKFDFLVTVDTINGYADTILWNNTIAATTIRIPIAELVPPIIKDTIYILDFDVKAKINTTTGAPKDKPFLHIETVINNSVFLKDSLKMELIDSVNGIWQASVPPQYYGSKVIYYLTVSDTIGNLLTLKDSVYITLMELGKIDTVIIGTGTNTGYHSPISMNNNYSWSRQIYLYSEVCPNSSPTGTYITKIAWNSIAANAVYNNQSCYMRAVDQSEQTTNYLNPQTNGAIEVWNGTLNITPGWVEITLDTAFFLPANKNLEIIWQHQNGFSTNTSHTWAHSATQSYMTVYGESNAGFPTVNGTRSYDRPNIRITKEASFKPYTGNDLGLISFLYPSSDLGGECAPDYTPVTVMLANLGENDYDFSTDSIALQLEISAPRETAYAIHIPINSGIFTSGSIDTIEFMSALPIMHAGEYEIKAWLANFTDNVIYDDTILYSYTAGRITLPLDDDFSSTTLSSNFTVFPVIDTAVWTPYNDLSSTVQPVFGTGLLRFAGKHGSMSRLSIKQLDLDGAVMPRLEFWFYHDSTAHVLDKSYTDVNVIVDGVSTTVLSLFRKDTAHGWKHYTVNLSSYRVGQCVLIEFISTNKFGTESVQYLDRIFITSMLDLSVSDISISPEIAVCDMDNKEVKVIIRTTTSQAIDFSQYNTSLAIELPNYATQYYPLTGIMPGFTSNTISTAPDISIPFGEHIIKAYFSSPVDSNSLNDTAYLALDFSPDLSLTVKSLTTGDNCFLIGTPVHQEIVLQNTGNMNLPDIKLDLRVTGDNYTETVTETKTINLLADSSMFYSFDNAYTVPDEAWYQVQVSASLGCNTVLINKANAVNECADIHNVSIDSLINPPMDRIDTVGSTEIITVSIKNESDNRRYENVNITMLITDENEQMINSSIGIIPVIEANSTYQFTFTEAYTVPEHSYFIRVYLNSIDRYPEKDTLSILRTTVKREVGITSLGGSNVFTLGQNMPNPANDVTRIDFSVPEAGEVIFHVHSISGQLLYSKTIESPRGTNSIELNTSTFAAGVYFYSMEYKGQRLMKQLIINN